MERQRFELLSPWSTTWVASRWVVEFVLDTVRVSAVEPSTTNSMR